MQLRIESKLILKCRMYEARVARAFINFYSRVNRRLQSKLLRKRKSDKSRLSDLSWLRILSLQLLRYNSEFFVAEFRTYRNKKCCNLENSSQQSYVSRPWRLHAACIDQLAENYSDSPGRAGETCRSVALCIPCSSRHFSKCGPTIHAGQIRPNVERYSILYRLSPEGETQRDSTQWLNLIVPIEIHRLVRSIEIYN